MTDPLPFFAYGTLRPGLRNHQTFLAGRCALIRPAVLDGLALHDGPGYPFVLPEPGRRVIGDLITVRPAAYRQVLAELDELEGCRADGTGLYLRERLTVRVGGADEPAWVYLAGPAAAARLRAHPAPIASGDWTRRTPG
ncbi:gamma-glutamylcyclotransferase family protein [Kitasatospora viridis]|uniref:Gamma-glutamylcyclotransferase (GGCT)/AIG2-like uncharacterized protein YtfP n=1 Tax=Kitasatospora viridis TaxID=281105 RepID=A0A561UBN1_9ACTN|nr:gamma-glutamylcyclotransferase family protein [Kitasatospora viridis]TWF96756.1 gamma-glutamylcyclotransferase (GGCT)/AIG2-like uncharacterized protein YtfP [Kitasatospora viridis]